MADSTIEELLAKLEASSPGADQGWEGIFQSIASEIGSNGQAVDIALENLEVTFNFSYHQPGLLCTPQNFAQISKFLEIFFSVLRFTLRHF